jgi:hypothetical protein
VRLWRGLLAVDRRTVIEDVELAEEDGAELVVARVRPRGRVLLPGGAARCVEPTSD